MDYDFRLALETIENELIESMMRNFRRHRAEEDREGYLWSQWQAEQLKSLEKYRKVNAEKYGVRFTTINAKISHMIEKARADGSADQEIAILEAIQNGFKVPSVVPDSMTGEFFKINDRKLDALIKATTDDLEKAETAILRRANDQYRSAIFNAQVYVNTGAGTYEKAVDMACRDMLRSGLACVEYSNGARHTLSDYADMALRTANKRAYLYGEGEKRKEWGLSLVVVNSRQGGCSKCAEYIGKIFIDDVYSGGTQSDGDYPLLSTAIEGGLFHPRCKDSTSTYYEGITTLKPVSKEEMAEMDRREKLEEQQLYYKNQAKKNKRIADNSLDKDNQRIFQFRADENAKKADEIGERIHESGISSKKYTRTSQNTVNLEYIKSQEYHNKFKNITDNGVVNEQLYKRSKAMLIHRNGTDKEDMYLIHSVNGKICGEQTHSFKDFGVEYNDSLLNAIKEYPQHTLIAVHNHSTNLPPSGNDLISAGGKKYKFGIVVTHNGKVFKYSSGNKPFSVNRFARLIDKYRGYGYNLSEYEATVKALDEFTKLFGIEWSECV